MTIDTDIDTTVPSRGRMFAYSSGRGIALLPSGDDGRWVILNPGTQTVESIRLANVEWAPGRATDDEILSALVAACQATFQRALEAVTETERLDATIGEIREYAIDRHREGHFCREGLNDALEHFGLDRYEPRFTTTVTLTATAEINADNAHAARSRLQHLIDGVAYSGEEYADDLDVTMVAIDFSEFESA